MESKKGLFVFFDGLSPTIIDSQVLLHVHEMRQQGFDIEVWSLPGKASLYKMSLSRLEHLSKLYELPITLIRSVSHIIPGAELINAIIIYREIKKRNIKISFVHARTDYSACVCGCLKWLLNFMLIWDCRGDEEAEFLHSYKANYLFQRIIKWLHKNRCRIRTFFALRVCDKAIFVSEKLKEKKSGSYLSDKIVEIIPCAASENIFYFSKLLREAGRKKCGFNDQDIVIVYSGSISFYQSFDKCIDLFYDLHFHDKNVKLLLLTPDAEIAKSMLNCLPIESYVLLSLPIEKVNEYLNSADFGLLLREKNDVNIVASPVKFGEYCLSGLPIISNGAVDQINEIGSCLNNLVDYNEITKSKKLVKFKDEERVIISECANELLSKKAVHSQYVRIYSNH